MTRILIVGAGAVGQAYALGLKRAGVQVTFFVKPHHVERLRRGMRVQEVGLLSVGPLEDLSEVDLLTDWASVAELDFHSIWLAVDGTALMGDWLEKLAASRGQAGVVAFQTGVGGRERLRSLIPDEVLVVGMIPFLAWWAPLDDKAPLPSFDPPAPPRMRIWHPPFMKTPLSGPAATVADLVQLLRAGGLPARPVENASATGSMGSAVLLPIIAGLEVAGWSLRQVASDPVAELVMRSAQQARAVAARITGARTSGLAEWLLRPLVLRWVVRLAPWCTPLDLETYLRVHFIKVGAQTSHTLQGLVEEGTAHSLSVDALTELLDQLSQCREASSSAVSRGDVVDEA